MVAMRLTISTAALMMTWIASPRADECETLATHLTAQIPKLEISERRSENDSVVLQLKHPDAAKLSLTCAAGDTDQPVLLAAQWNEPWPPSPFYDLVASAGAILAANTEPAVRSGAIICAQKALTADSNKAIYDANDTHFECMTTAGVGGSTHIIISKRKGDPQ